MVALAYRKTHRGFNYAVSFVNTLVFLPMVTAVVMMVIGNNLARAEGQILKLTYTVRLRAPERVKEFVRTLGAVDGITSVSLVSMEETADA
ncbi:MAG: hypothetical protein KAY24_17105 [Candidatus Eisenbacteria sp.]|nr:hypothetical protein [Candidatus Eisenbacteria bacterium]